MTKSRVWIAEDGSWGMSQLISLDLTEHEVDVIADMSDRERWKWAVELERHRDVTQLKKYNGPMTKDLQERALKIIRDHCVAEGLPVPESISDAGDTNYVPRHSRRGPV